MRRRNALESACTLGYVVAGCSRVLEFQEEFNYPALLMLLFCTILRRNYPVRLNGQALKSPAFFRFVFIPTPFYFIIFPSPPLGLVRMPLVARYYDFNFTEIDRSSGVRCP